MTVIVPAVLPCGDCEFCRAGRGNLCRRMFFLGSASVFPHAQGLFREAIVIGEAQLTPVREPGITLGEIACAEPQSGGASAQIRTSSTFHPLPSPGITAVTRYPQRT